MFCNNNGNSLVTFCSNKDSSITDRRSVFSLTSVLLQQIDSITNPSNSGCSNKEQLFLDLSMAAPTILYPSIRSLPPRCFAPTLVAYCFHNTFSMATYCSNIASFFFFFFYSTFLTVFMMVWM